MLTRKVKEGPAGAKIRLARPTRRAFFYVYNLVFGVLLLLVSSALAGVERTDFRVNDDAASAPQSDPRIAVAADGSFIIVWTDHRRGNNDIFLQRFDTGAEPVGDNLRINDDDATDYQAQPSVGVDFSGRYLTVWQDYRTYGYPFAPDIYLQQFDTSLTPIDTNRFLTPGDSVYRDMPDISLSAWGTGVVVWSDYRNNNWDIYGQLIGADGRPVGGNFKVNDDNGGQQHAPRVSTSSLGWFVVTWYDDRFGNDDIFVQRFDSSGTALGPNFKMNTDATPHRQIFPDVATDGAGHFTVVWVDYRNGQYPNNPDIYTAKLDTTLLPVTANTRMNTDGTIRAQKNPAIAADRMGNVAVIWADSTGSSWDIIGQMLDVDGIVHEVNFAANTETDSAQFKPDVALDGRYRYITWMDRREGNYDIYASVTEYNDPRLIVEPVQLEFEMSRGAGLPATQYITVQHAGYNRLDFDVTSFNSWLNFAPASTSTPDSIGVSIATDTLADGIHHGAISIVDRVNFDSTIVVPVSLEVSSAVLNVSVDTLQFRLPTGYDTTSTQLIAITNGGAGALPWTASEPSPWLTLSADSGTTPSNIEVTVDPTGLVTGNYVTAVFIDAGAAEESPDTVWIRLEMSDTLPMLLLAPTAIVASVTDPAAFDTFVVVSNVGGGDLLWQATGGAPWLTLNPSSGGNLDTVILTLDEDNLAAGLNGTSIDILAANAFNGSARLTVTIDHSPLLVDTVDVAPSNVMPGSIGTTALTLYVHNEIVQLALPLQYDTSLIMVDSLLFGSGLPLFMDKFYRIDPAAGTINISLQRTPPDMAMAAGSYLLGDLFFTAGFRQGTALIDTLNNDSLAPLVVTLDTLEKTPVVLPGAIQVGVATDIDPDADPTLPSAFALHQNYPNPFNAGTVIEFDLPRMVDVRLDIFDILGRRIRRLTDGRLSAGRHRLTWDGTDDSRADAPSGVYFYRLVADRESLAAKMLLLK